MPNSKHDSADWQRLFGHRLRFLRTLENLTQADLAGRVRITVEHLSNMERGVSAPSFAMVIRLAEALGAEPASLFLFARDRPGAPAGESPDFEWTRYIAAVGSYEYVAHTGKTFWSDSLYRLLGLEPGEVAAGPEAFARQVHPADRDRATQAAAELLAGRDLPMQSFRVLRKDGRERFVLTHRVVEQDAAGRLLRLHGMVLDVTEQRLLQDSLRTMHANLEEQVRMRTLGLAETVVRLEEEVGRRTRAEALARENEIRLRSLGDNLAGGAVFQLAQGADGSRRLAYASAGLAALLGSGPGNGQPDLEQVLAAMLPEDREAFLADMERCAAGGQALRCEVRFLRPDGAPAWVRIQAAHRVFPDGRMVCDGLALDVSDLKQAEQERRLAVQRLQRAQALTRLGHWEYHAGGGSCWWSDELYEAFGHEPQSRPVTHDFFLSHVHPDDRERVAQEFAEAVAGQRECRTAFRIIRKDGSPGFGYSIGRPMPGFRPGQAVYHGTYLDVTEHKAACAGIQAESERLRGLMAAAGLGTWAWEGLAVRFDAATCRILGLPPDTRELSKEQGLALILPEDQSRLPGRQAHGPVQTEFQTVLRVQPPGGAMRRVLLTGAFHRNPKGAITRAEGLLLGLEGLVPA